MVALNYRHPPHHHHHLDHHDHRDNHLEPAIVVDEEYCSKTAQKAEQGNTSEYMMFTMMVVRFTVMPGLKVVSAESSMAMTELKAMMMRLAMM